MDLPQVYMFLMGQNTRHVTTAENIKFPSSNFTRHATSPQSASNFSQLAIARPQQHLYFLLRRPSRRIADLPARAPRFLLSLLEPDNTPAVHVEPSR